MATLKDRQSQEELHSSVLSIATYLTPICFYVSLPSSFCVLNRKAEWDQNKEPRNILIIKKDSPPFFLQKGGDSTTGFHVPSMLYFKTEYNNIKTRKRSKVLMGQWLDEFGDLPPSLPKSVAVELEDHE